MKAARTSQPPRRLPTFWQSNLVQEASALAVLILLFAGSSVLTLAHLRQRYIAVAAAEAEKVELLLNDQLREARQQLQRFARLPDGEHRLPMAALLTDFSDLYQLNRQLEVSRVIKRLPTSQVFPQFSLQRSPLASYLLQPRAGDDFSPLLRGVEDGRPSIYIALANPTGLLLGRLNLESLQRFLRQFSSAAQTPVLLVARDGSVLLSSDDRLRIPAFDLNGQWQEQLVRPALQIGGHRWIPIVTPAPSVGAAIVTLVPTGRLAEEQRLILVLLLVASAGSTSLVVIKSLRMRRRFIEPIADLARRMRHLESGAAAEQGPAPAAAFAELEAIETAFHAMAGAIREREQQLRQRASTDELTGLLNRRALLERLEELLADGDRRHGGGTLALLFCDLDLFKEINDTLGHAAGDLVLRSVAARIRRSIRSDDLAARMGGDEMVVVLRCVADQKDAVALAGTIARAIAQPISGDGVQARITASIGVTLARPGEDVDGLMARGDIAMYAAKKAGRNRVIPFG